MGVSTSLGPIKDQAFGYPQARHLLNRAGFGASREQVAAIQTMGPAKAVDFMVDYQAINNSDMLQPQYDPDVLRQATSDQRMVKRRAKQEKDRVTLAKLRFERNRREAEDRRQMANLRCWWLQHMIMTPRPLEEKLVLLWHSHFASNYRTVRSSILMFNQNLMFRQQANNSFAQLAMSIVRDPAMIKFLNNDSNRKDHPNENFARELMELFTLGEGNYTEHDIKEGARALTGYSVRNTEFAFERRQHDSGQKVILGKRGQFDGDDFVRIILAKKQCAMFIAYKLYKYFVNDLSNGPDKSIKLVIGRLGYQLYKKQYQLTPVLKMLFASEHFYDPSNVGNMIKSSAQLVAGLVRVLQTPVRDANILTDGLNIMGQQLFDPPSVAGWEGGRSWINTSTLFARQNVAAYLIAGKLPFKDGWSRDGVAYDPLFLIDDLPNRTPSAVVDSLLLTLVNVRVSPQRRQQLINFLNSRGGTINADTMIALLLLVTTMPEFQLC